MSLQKEIPYKESLQGSWVELHYNTGSGSQGSQEQISTTPLDVDLEKLLLDAQHESSRSTSPQEEVHNATVRLGHRHLFFCLEAQRETVHSSLRKITKKESGK
ncbi:hypothetical protein J4Q44_G00386670 [Coregonus suidteri]|uniref:Uncharacterized protein n=1 Tax=Coregonus suidteri TaxID=861788 RepID=A0AAN8K9L5_9TELE